ncbi:MAG TPA: MBOAT family protein [Flavobacteriales bacterium]|mgnify:CR=1 FL=1|nr:MBOAT family protein [Flavobacteriales bacterium]|tara:strand:+ start:18307 stop:20001 length:1695 start_codon:yes stop_codon:yes gene_type:complete
MNDFIQYIDAFFSAENLKSLLLYSEKSPLLFTQFYFWGFFALVLLGYSVVYKNKAVRNAYLFFASLFFYYKTSGFFFFILLFSTFTDFYVGLAIAKSSHVLKRKLLLTFSIVVNLFLLIYFKYAYFFTESFNQLFHTNYKVLNHFAQFANTWAGTHFEVDKILLPVGISFFTFQTMSYSIDVYRGHVKPVKNMLDFGFYVSFFPQLVAGPIVRAADFIPQLYKPYFLSKRMFGWALFMILNGLIKKLVLGDYIAVNFIDRVFSNPGLFTGFENTMALFGYSLQVYADFSGYTDIAIGVALLMGFKLPKNFNSPYKARNVAEFWKRWHISLSNWLKDYLYIPLGGNRKGSIGTYVSLIIIAFFLVLISKSWLVGYFTFGIILFLFLGSYAYPAFRKHVAHNINLLVTMLLGGLWHGASFQFIIWGGLNGIALIIYKFWRKISPYQKIKHPLKTAWVVLFTLTFITFTRIWFRAEKIEDTWTILHQITHQFAWDKTGEMILGYKTVFFVILIGYLIHWIPTKFKRLYKNYFIQMPLYGQFFVTFLAVLFIYQFITADLQAFIYFQF